FGVQTGFFTRGNAPSIFDDNTWDDGNGLSAAAAAVDGMTPRFIVEHLGQVDLSGDGELPRDLGSYGTSENFEFEYARIVVRAQGPSGQSRRMLEGFYVFQPEAAGAGAGGL